MSLTHPAPAASSHAAPPRAAAAPVSLNIPARDAALPSLTPLRGLAALWVVLYHITWQYFPQLDSTPYTQAIARGYLAVDLFFLLSGFVLTHVYLAAFTRRPSWRGYHGFLAARVARVYPLHLFMLALFVAAELLFMRGRLAIPLEGPMSLTALGANLLMMQGLRAGELSWNYPAWSISLEFVAYLAFPLLLPLIVKIPRAGRVLIALALVAMLGGLALATGDQLNQWDGPLALLRCLPEFFLGSLAYLVYRSGALAGLLAKDVLLAVALAAIALAMHVGAPDILAVPLFLAAILAGAGNRGLVGAWLNCRPLIWLGDISYSIYLAHGFMLYAIGRLMPRLFSTVDAGDLSFAEAAASSFGMFAATFLLAAATYPLVELRGRRWLRQRLAPRDGRAAPHKSRPGLAAPGDAAFS